MSAWDVVRVTANALARRDREARSLLVKRRRRAGLTHGAIDALVGEEGWARYMERYDSDPTLSQMRRYEALIVHAEYDATTQPISDEGENQ